MDYIDDELASILHEDLPNKFCCPSPYNLTSLNISKTNSPATTICAAEPSQVSLQPQQKPNDSDELYRNEGRQVERAKHSRTVNRKSRVRPPSQTYNHIIAERKRREQLSERFITLSTLVPGLKKMDKTSVLGDAIEYMKILQEKVKTMEERATYQKIEPVVSVKKSRITVEDEGYSDGKCSGLNDQPLPEIEAKVSNTSILLKILCEKRKGVLLKILAEVEKLNITIVSSNVTPFGSLVTEITIIGEMDIKFNSQTEDVVRALRSAVLDKSASFHQMSQPINHNSQFMTCNKL